MIFSVFIFEKYTYIILDLSGKVYAKIFKRPVKKSAEKKLYLIFTL